MVLLVMMVIRMLFRRLLLRMMMMSTGRVVIVAAAATFTRAMTVVAVMLVLFMVLILLVVFVMWVWDVVIASRMRCIICKMVILLCEMMRWWTGHVLAMSTVWQMRRVLHSNLVAVMMRHVSLGSLHHRRLDVCHELRHSLLFSFCFLSHKKSGKGTTV